MIPTLSAPVGKKGTNDPDDVRIVQTLLNGFVSIGRLGSLSPLAVSGDWKPTVPYIEKFQKDVAGLSKPDGNISPDGITWKKLKETPSGVYEHNLAASMIYTALGRPPVDSIHPDLWRIALNSLLVFLDHKKLYRPEIVTFMNFSISPMEPRLWTVNIRDHVLLHRSHVAHGTNSGPPGRIPKDFGDGERKTSLGAFVTLTQYDSKLGHVTKPEPATKVIGLQKGTNGRAWERGIVFHAATYVDPPRTVGNSWGCFSTPVPMNRLLIPQIANGTFAFSYGG